MIENEPERMPKTMPRAAMHRVAAIEWRRMVCSACIVTPSIGLAAPLRLSPGGASAEVTRLAKAGRAPSLRHSELSRTINYQCLWGFPVA